MERSYELENLRRSIAMLSPGSLALPREDALALLAELSEVQRRQRLRSELQRLVDDTD